MERSIDPWAPAPQHQRMTSLPCLRPKTSVVCARHQHPLAVAAPSRATEHCNVQKHCHCTRQVSRIGPQPCCGFWQSHRTGSDGNPTARAQMAPPPLPLHTRQPPPHDARSHPTHPPTPPPSSAMIVLHPRSSSARRSWPATAPPDCAAHSTTRCTAAAACCWRMAPGPLPRAVPWHFTAVRLQGRSGPSPTAAWAGCWRGVLVQPAPRPLKPTINEAVMAWELRVRVWCAGLRRR